MGILKLLIAVIIIALIWKVIQVSKQSATIKNKNTNASQKVIACAVCGVHTPEHECIQYQNQHFCSQAHLTTWQNK